MQLCDLDARRGAQGGVEVRQRLVEQKDLGIAHDRPAERDALALPAGERMRPAVEQLGEAEGRGDGSDAALDLGPVDAAPAQAEGEVLAHAHMRVERVGLEHHGDVAILRRHRVDDAPVDRRAVPDEIDSSPAIIRASWSCRSPTARAAP